MRTTPIMLLLLAGCLEPRALEVSDEEVRVAMGSGVDVVVLADGVQIERLDWFALAVDDPAIASATLDGGGGSVRITGQAEGATIVRVRYRATELEVMTVVEPRTAMFSAAR